MVIGLPTPRQHQLVTRVIEEYIRTAEPVSSKAIASSGYFDVRSATIRNEMADLEHMGYLEQLHTSGGRVPTAKAYRLYVNGLVAREGVNISHAHRRRMDEALTDTDLDDPEAVNKTLARLVGSLSGSLVMANLSRHPDAYKTGLSNLMTLPEFREFERLAGVTEFFDQFDAMAERMFRRMWDRGDSEVKVLIGTEAHDDRIKDESLVCARYQLPQGHQGTLTLVGPMRMDYRKNIGLITYAAQAANRIA
jgi:heat-inducible transcriptional repressor